MNRHTDFDINLLRMHSKKSDNNPEKIYSLDVSCTSPLQSSFILNAADKFGITLTASVPENLATLESNSILSFLKLLKISRRQFARHSNECHVRQ